MFYYALVQNECSWSKIETKTGPLHRFNECHLFQREETTQMGNWPLVSQARPATEKKEEKKKQKKETDMTRVCL